MITIEEYDKMNDQNNQFNNNNQNGDNANLNVSNNTTSTPALDELYSNMGQPLPGVEQVQQTNTNQVAVNNEMQINQQPSPVVNETYQNQIPTDMSNPNYQNNVQPTINSGYDTNIHSSSEAPIKVEKSENIILGAIGALIGSLLGGVSIYLLLKLGFISALSGVLIALGAFYGYKLLGHKIGTVGIVVCCVIMVISVYVSYRAAEAISLMELTNIDFFEAFADLMTYLERGNADDVFYTNLIQILGFSALGAAGVIRAEIVKNKKMKQNA